MCFNCFIFHFSVNGEQHGYIKPTSTRGLRQGDPLSPYLFLLCAEGLSSLLSQKENQGQLQGIKICRGGPSIIIPSTVCRRLTYVL